MSLLALPAVHPFFPGWWRTRVFESFAFLARLLDQRSHFSVLAFSHLLVHADTNYPTTLLELRIAWLGPI